MKDMLSYEELLDLAESFMEKSGVRAYCSEICKGHCCNGCYVSDGACHKNEGRRLACSTFLCYNLRKRVLTQEQQRAYSKMTDVILDEMRGTPSAYFEPISKSFRDRTQFNTHGLEFITNTRTPRGIRNKLPKQSFIEAWKKR